MADLSDDWVTLARLIKTQGHRGELAADLLTDVPGRFDGLEHVWLARPQQPPAPFTIKHFWFHQGRIVFGFQEIPDMNAALAWVGADLQVPASERAPAPEGSYYLDDLVGCELHDRDRVVGRVTSVEPVPGASALLHVAAELGEVLVPFVDAFLDAVVLDQRLIRMHLPEGLLDINL